VAVTSFHTKHYCIITVNLPITTDCCFLKEQHAILSLPKINLVIYELKKDTNIALKISSTSNIRFKR